jgi:hypothetical protein
LKDTALGDGKQEERGISRHIKVIGVEQILRLFHHLATAYGKQRAFELLAEENVLGNGHMRHLGQLLVNNGDVILLSISHGADEGFFAVYDDVTLID